MSELSTERPARSKTDGGGEGNERGYIIPIGGAERRHREGEVLNRFVQLCGGRRASIAVIPTASELKDTGPTYRHLFQEMGAQTVDVLPYEERVDTERRELLEVLRAADGVFLAGGNQLRLSTVLGGTAVAEAIRDGNARGQHVAGTSAGAAILSEHMIAGGKKGGTPRSGMVNLAPGFGLIQRVIIDQHFRQRDRIGRLLAAISYNPRLLGLGVDEDTGAFIGPNDSIEVVGNGGVTIVDASEARFSSIDRVRRGEPVTILGARVDILAAGAVYDLPGRRATPPPVVVRSE